jgi:quinoprotein glucose dehydrogenase
VIILINLLKVLKKTKLKREFANNLRSITTKVLPFAMLALVLGACQQQSKDGTHETWEVYKGDAESTSYSGLRQIDKDNVQQLQIAWVYHTNDARKGKRSSNNENSPIVVDSVLYTVSPWSKILALNAYTGTKIWSFDPPEAKGNIRGLVYWKEDNDERILFTSGTNLFAVDARTGKLISSFGQEGKVSLAAGIGSPGIVYKNLLILGSSPGDGYNSPVGYQNAYNIKTGKLVWTFHTIPQPGEPGYETWPKDAWKYVGGVNNWAGMSLDKKSGLVFVPLGSPTYDFYGADRKGKNLFGNSIVALEAETGKLVWYYQTVHHDLWDYDLGAPPNLVTVKKDNDLVPAVAQITKQGFIFVLDRKTGKPLFPVEERKVPASDIPGEEAWPTQPVPLKPAPFSVQGLTPDNITKLSPEARESVLKKLRQLRNEGPFTPPSLKGTVNLPGSRGGARWGGAAYDPDSHVLYVNGTDMPEISTLKVNDGNNPSGGTIYQQGQSFYANNCAACHGDKRQGQGNEVPSLMDIEKRMDEKQITYKIKHGGGRMPAFNKISDEGAHAIVAYLFNNRKAKQTNNSNAPLTFEKNNNPERKIKYMNSTPFALLNDLNGKPAVNPPWATLNAINLNTGEYEWKIPLGTATEQNGGPIVTAGGLVFIGATSDNMFRAFDKKTGKLLWETKLPGWGRATPMTYMSRGKQFIVITLSGENDGSPVDTIIAFALSE